jgi:hypothetical protein
MDELQPVDVERLERDIRVYWYSEDDDEVDRLDKPAMFDALTSTDSLPRNLDSRLLLGVVHFAASYYVPADDSRPHPEAKDHLERLLRDITQANREPGATIDARAYLAFWFKDLSQLEILSKTVVESSEYFDRWKAAVALKCAAHGPEAIQEAIARLLTREDLDPDVRAVLEG